MADKGSLGIVGLAFGGVTLAVAIVAFLVVSDHVAGRLTFEQTAATQLTPSAQLASVAIR